MKDQSSLPSLLRAKELTRGLSVLLVIFSALSVPSESFAEKQETMQKRLEKEKTVRLQRLMRSGRTEFSLALGSSLGDAYRRNHPISLTARQHISDSFGLGLTVFYALSSETSLAEEIQRVRPNRVQGEESFSTISLGAGLDAIYTPIHGKLSLLGISAIRYDLSLTGGLHFLQVSGAESDGFKPAPSVGLSGHFFLDQQLAITVFFKNFIYSYADHSVLVAGSPSADPSWSLHSFGGLALSFFLGKPTIGSE